MGKNGFRKTRITGKPLFNPPEYIPKMQSDTDRGDEGTRDALSPGSAVRRRHAIHYLCVEVFGAPE